MSQRNVVGQTEGDMTLTLTSRLRSREGQVGIFMKTTLSNSNFLESPVLY